MMTDKFTAGMIAFLVLLIGFLVVSAFNISMPDKPRFRTVQEQREHMINLCVDRIKEQPNARALCQRIVQLRKSQFK